MYESVEITKCKVPTSRYCSQKYIHYSFYIDALNWEDIKIDLLFSKLLVKESKDRLFWLFFFLRLRGSLLLLLSHVSRVWLCATPQTAAHQAPLSLGFSRQEHWSGLPLPSPMDESEKWKWSRSVVPTLSNPMDCSLPGSSAHGILQARVLEWGATAFSKRQPTAV